MMEDLYFSGQSCARDAEKRRDRKLQAKMTLCFMFHLCLIKYNVDPHVCLQTSTL